ncbi:MAG: hypothetical protein KUG71_00355 [Porticoccaceae bacterium]|nr:hypothetical protein [Porticoccaceae bacterium]
MTAVATIRYFASIEGRFILSTELSAEFSAELSDYVATSEVMILVLVAKIN